MLSFNRPFILSLIKRLSTAIPLKPQNFLNAKFIQLCKIEFYIMFAEEKNRLEGRKKLIL